MSVCVTAVLSGDRGCALSLGALPQHASGAESDTTSGLSSVSDPEDSSSLFAACNALSLALIVATIALNFSFFWVSSAFLLKKSGRVWNPWACRSLRAFFCLLTVLPDLPCEVRACLPISLSFCTLQLWRAELKCCSSVTSEVSSALLIPLTTASCPLSGFSITKCALSGSMVPVKLVARWIRR